MDTTAEITFDENGVCCFCHQAKQALAEIEKEKHNLQSIVDQIIKDGSGNKYDCLIGLSGGVDSSTVLYNAIKLGLRPLCFSFENTWNTPMANENIMRLVETLKVPFYRYNIDIKKYGELQEAFFKGGIRNIEAITDHILFAITYEMAVKYNIKWVLSGGNTATESIMPASWGEDPRDLRWIKAVYKKHTGKKLVGLPVISLIKEQYYRLIKRIKFVRLLDYYDYNRENEIKVLMDNYGYRPYGEKHGENLFTLWFQNFFLYKKYGIDKRKAHYSSMICSGQITKEEAEKIIASAPEVPEEDIKKLHPEFIDLQYSLINTPKKEYQDYPNSSKVRKFVVLLYKIKKLWK